MALFSNMDQVREYIAVNLSSNFETILPYIKQAETKFIKPILGKELYEELLTIDEASSTPSDKMAELLKRVRLPLINYAYYLYVPVGNVNISDAGIRIAVNDNMKTAFDWQVDKVETAFLNTAHDFIEDVLEYLEENRAAFETWFNSDAFTMAHDMLIHSAKEFNEHFFINKSRRLYIQLRPIMKSIERKYIISTISKALYDEIIGELQSSDGPSENTQTLLNLIQPCLAKFTIARAISELSLEILPEGIFENAVQVVSKAKQAAGRDKLSVLTSDLTADARAELKEVQEYLDANASTDKYKAYFDSDLYIQPVEGETRDEFKNTSDSSIFFA